MREAPSRVLMEALWDAGAKVQAYDPEAMEEAQRIYGDRDDLVLCGTQGGGAATAPTRWSSSPSGRQFRSPDFDAHARSGSRTPVIFDGRNLYEPERRSRRPASPTTASAAAVRSASD